jgi:hypothetical protein
VVRFYNNIQDRGDCQTPRSRTRHRILWVGLWVGNFAFPCNQGDQPFSQFGLLLVWVVNGPAGIAETPEIDRPQEETARRPFGLIATPRTESEWPCSVRSSRPVSRSHTFSVSSRETETAIGPSGLTATPLTAEEWPHWPRRRPAQSQFRQALFGLSRSSLPAQPRIQVLAAISRQPRSLLLCEGFPPEAEGVGRILKPTSNVLGWEPRW